MATNNNPMDSNVEINLKGKELKTLKKQARVVCKEMQQL